MLVRHGQSTWNEVHRIQGQLDPPLSAEGRAQAKLLGARLAGRRFGAFYASDLKRAMETAEEIATSVHMQPAPDASLREIFLGDWEGLSTQEIAERFPAEWARWSERPDWDVVPGGERASDFERRVNRALDAIAERHPAGEVLVVTHGGVIQVALHRVVGRPSHGLFPFKIQNASMSVLERRDGRVVIAGVNDIAHLEESVVPDHGSF